MEKAGDRNLNDAMLQLTAALQPHGFVRNLKYEWRRESEWKTDSIVADVRSGLDMDVLFSFLVTIPTAEPLGTKEWPFLHLAQENVPRILGRPANYSRISKWQFMHRRFTKRLISDVQNALPWFDQFDSPEACLNCLSHFLNAKSEAFQEASRYLREVAINK